MEESEQRWDLKKIIIGLVVIGVFGWFIYQQKDMIAEYNNQPTKAIAGVSSEKTEANASKSTTPQFDLQQKITDITAQVSNLNTSEVAASSPQIQKVLKDMESLKALPQNQVKDACLSICSSL